MSIEIFGQDHDKEMTPETSAHIQRLIDFVRQTAVFPGGGTPDLISSAVLTGIQHLEGVVLQAQVIEDHEGRPGHDIANIEVTYPGGYSEYIDAAAGDYFVYAFGTDIGYWIYPSDSREQEALVTSLFLRYDLDYYGQHPELWRPIDG